MPVCFSLTKIGEKSPTLFQAIDDEMRASFGVEPDAVKWYCGWYDIIGFRLAVGQSFEEIENEVADEKLKEIARWLKERYTADSWREVGRR